MERAWGGQRPVRTRLVPVVATTCLLLALGAWPAWGVDGVIEINAARALVGGVTPGDGPGYPITISQRGSYRLTGVLVVQDQTAIDVTAEGVSIDLNGHGIHCATTCTTGKGIVTNVAGIRIRDGFVRGMGETGIHVRERARIRNVDASSNGEFGVIAGSGGIFSGIRARRNDLGGVSVSGVLRDSSAQDNGLNGFRASQGVMTRNVAIKNGGAAGASTDGNGLKPAGGVVSGNVSRRNSQNGIRSQQPTALLGNTVSDNSHYGLFNEGFGDLGYADNVVEGNAAGTVFCLVGSACVEMGGNLCNGVNACP